ncbi:hypothetical protein CVT26_002443, partial [Gymnopilus dilepis]
MTIIEPQGAPILVTGANGYIGLWIVRTLLEKGYSVRAVVRSSHKGHHMKKIFGIYRHKLEIYDGAFDAAVKDVYGIIHSAATAILNPVEPDEYVRPAVDGTVGILESARKFGNTVRRIVLTSSVAAIGFNLVEPAITFDETNWNDAAEELVNAKGKDAPPLIKYAAAKNLAEKGKYILWNMYKEEVQWDLVTIQPSTPPLQAVRSPDALNVSMWMIWDPIANERSDNELRATCNYVHVRDTALAHVEALRKEEAGGERIIASS